MLITAAALVVAIAVTAFLTFSRYARSENWRATVTPLASIIGSGFLICGPLLAHEFGSAALPAMAALLLLAYAVGAVVRFNITHIEDFSADAAFHDPIAWLARATQAVLAIAYAVSVAYYLKLLAEFTLKTLPVPERLHTLAANGIVTAIILLLAALAFGGGLKKVEHVAHGSVSIKIGAIAGLLAGLGIWWVVHAGATPASPPMRLSAASLPMLLGLLITVQGFETSRYLGGSYSQAVRARTMRHAQWIASGIYLAFLALLTPFLGQAASAEGVAGILDIFVLVAAPMAIFVLVAAVSSQLSAAVADSIGASGLMGEVSRRKIGPAVSFALASALAIAVVWLTDPFEVVALSSRAFALFYALQCALAVAVSMRKGTASWPLRIGFTLIGLICLVATLVGAPAE
ncbi:MAG: hypothetical protein GC145_08910 [Caulobacter sp.]|nr:hypothetical protein [Caulobacter sp.]